MAKNLILLIEDEISIRDMLTFSFAQTDYQLKTAENVPQAKKLLLQYRPDLILMDWMLPGKSGIDFAKDLQNSEKYCHIPIIMLTAKNSEEDKLEGFMVGVDDYVAKPFSPKELLARIKAVMRRLGSEQSNQDEVSLGELKINFSTHRVTAYENELKLGPLEFKILAHFANNKERVISRPQLLDAIWGLDCYIDERTVDVHIRRLRKVLATQGQQSLIQTVRGSGYRLSTH